MTLEEAQGCAGGEAPPSRTFSLGGKDLAELACCWESYPNAMLVIFVVVVVAIIMMAMVVVTTPFAVVPADAYSSFGAPGN